MSQQIIFLIFGLVAVSARHVNFYRKDYTYIQEYDAFYKFHNDGNGSSWNSSFLTCDDEGAELFYPSSDDEWEVASKLVQATPLPLDSVNDIFVGIHDQFYLGEYVTINGRPTNISIENLDTTSDKQHCVTMDIETGVYRINDCNAEPQYRPFICKKVEDISCPTIDQGYKYTKETRKCYKVNYNQKTWTKSMESCFMEGGSLLVLGSSMEAEIVSKLLENVNQEYHAGFKKMFPINEFYTVKGHKLQDSGFNVWYNRNNNDNDCGIIYKTSDSIIYLRDTSCDNTLLPFVCEMEVEA